ncbi:MAG TPA: LLM class F420-dependent oxidoreductase [Mycobacteriales bacterium]|nr:LLM class F420-dependent oxidoreductase [Mycobacteriales bacterium]
MQLRVFTEPQQGATYDDLLRVAKATEELGFDAFFRSDHYKRIGPGDPGPGSTDAWVTLGALARETSRIRLGTLLSPVTFRLPGPLAISVAQVDEMSSGRVELGLGTGWFGEEHTAYGIPFHTTGERFERLAEQLAIVTGLWDTPSGATFSYQGKHYTVQDSPGLPKPRQRPRPPIVIGGHGHRRTPALAAEYADEFNIPFPDKVATAAAQFDRVRRACTDAGRDPASIRLSAALVLCCGRDDAEVKRRADAIGQSQDHLRGGQAAGTVAEVVDRIGEYADAGATRIYLQTLDLGDLDHLELVASEVQSQV